MAELSFLETDAQNIHDTIILALEKEVNEPLYPGDERKIFGEAMTAVIVAAFNKMNDACKKKMLQYASGETLDALGERYACYRILPSPAKTTIRFKVNEAVSSNIVIESGTRVTPDNDIYFQTIENAVLQAGDTQVDVAAECTATGSQYNGYLVGSINQLVDLVPYIDVVTNIVETYDGDDGEPYPEDDGGTGDIHYRDRIRLAPKSLSVAGPRDAYEYYAKSADASIADVAVLSEVQTLSKTADVVGGKVYIGGSGYISNSIEIENAQLGTDYTVTYANELLVIDLTGKLQNNSTLEFTIKRDMAGQVLIVPILYGGKIPDNDILEKVRKTCSADDVRPMTDKVVVQAPQKITYDISITYYTTNDAESDCIDTIEGIGGAVEQYIEWQGTKMGREINPDKLRALCLAPKEGTGCERIVITSPRYRTLEETQIAIFSGNKTITHVVEE